MTNAEIVTLNPLGVILSLSKDVTVAGCSSSQSWFDRLTMTINCVKVKLWKNVCVKTLPGRPV